VKKIYLSFISSDIKKQALLYSVSSNTFKAKLGCAGLKRKLLLLKDVLVWWNKKKKFAVLIILLGSPYLF